MEEKDNISSVRVWYSCNEKPKDKKERALHKIIKKAKWETVDVIDTRYVETAYECFEPTVAMKFEQAYKIAMWRIVKQNGNQKDFYVINDEEVANSEWNELKDFVEKETTYTDNYMRNLTTSELSLFIASANNIYYGERLQTDVAKRLLETKKSNQETTMQVVEIKKESKIKMAKQNNVVILSGKLFDDIEVKESANKKKYANVAILVEQGVDDKIKKTVFKAVAFGETTDKLKDLKAGDDVKLTGNLYQHQFNNVDAIDISITGVEKLNEPQNKATVVLEGFVNNKQILMQQSPNGTLYANMALTVMRGKEKKDTFFITGFGKCAEQFIERKSRDLVRVSSNLSFDGEKLSLNGYYSSLISTYEERQEKLQEDGKDKDKPKSKKQENGDTENGNN